MDFESESFRRDPYPTYAALRGMGPVVRDPRTGTVLLLGHDVVKRALSDHQVFSSAVSGPAARTSRWLLFMDPPRHTRLRALVARAFSPGVVAGLEPRIRALSGALIDAFPRTGQVDLAHAYAIPLPVMVIAELLGAPREDWERLQAWSNVAMALIHTLAPGPRAEAAVAAFAATHEDMVAYVLALAAARRAAPADDLMTSLTQVEDGEHLADEDLVGFFQLLLLAGHETTTNLIANAVRTLIEHPAALAALRADPALVPAAIEEVLRYRAPLQIMLRRVRTRVDLGGHDLPEGQLVLAGIGAANRDPALVSDADRFDVRRAPVPHLAFGQGIHACIGAPLARLEGSIALGDLIARLPDLAFVPGDPWQPREAFHVHGAARLPVRIQRAGSPAGV